MAKGVEDTAFYRYVRLLCAERGRRRPRPLLARRSTTSTAANIERARAVPAASSSTTQTHDTKRSGDVRARIGALDVARRRVGRARRRWRSGAPRRRPGATRSTCSTRRSSARGRSSRSASTRTWRRRCARRSCNTNWIEPNEAWERRVREFARALYEHEPSDDVRAVRAAGRRARRRGSRSAQTLLKLTVPGRPGHLPGRRALSLALVDPDNRRPVDWTRPRLGEVGRTCAAR